MNNQKRRLPARATVLSFLAEGFNVAASATVGFVGFFVLRPWRAARYVPW